MTLGANFFILNLPAFATKNTRIMVVSWKRSVLSEQSNLALDYFALREFISFK